jgi:hypothetical protein
MIVTTSSKDERLIEKALRFSETYGIPYRVRGEKSLAYLYETEDPQVFVVNHNRGLSYYEEGKSEAFFHPNMAFHRLRNLRQGGSDMLAVVCGLEPGMTFLDGTLGLASDAMTAACVVGEHGRVIGVEKSLPLYILVREGLAFHAEKEPEMRDISARMELHHADNLDFLRTCADGSCDVIYFDFMFHRPVSGSLGIDVIRNYAAYDVITPEHIAEAVRAARSRVVVKTDRRGHRTLAEMGFDCLKETSRGDFCYMGYNK